MRGLRSSLSGSIFWEARSQGWEYFSSKAMRAMLCVTEG